MGSHCFFPYSADAVMAQAEFQSSVCCFHIKGRPVHPVSPPLSVVIFRVFWVRQDTQEVGISMGATHILRRCIAHGKNTLRIIVLIILHDFNQRDFVNPVVTKVVIVDDFLSLREQNLIRRNLPVSSNWFHTIRQCGEPVRRHSI